MEICVGTVLLPIYTFLYELAESARISLPFDSIDFLHILDYFDINLKISAVLRCLFVLSLFALISSSLTASSPQSYNQALYIQSAKILFIPSKYEIIMVPSNHLNFQYCDINMGLFSIAPCKVITLNWNPFWYQFFASFLMTLSLKFSLLKAIAKRLSLLFANAFKSVKEQQLLLSQLLEER